MPEQTYNAESIQVLKGIEHVRKRPGMYIGDTSTSGLHHLIYEVIDNSIDEALAGYCTEIKVILTTEGSAIVEDNGRGIPVGIHPGDEQNRTALEIVMTELNAGGKFNRDSYKVSGGLHGVGVSVVNALSEWVKVEVCIGDGRTHYQCYKRGISEGEVSVTFKGEDKNNSKQGTKVEFCPDKEIFNDVKFDYNIVSERVRELAYLNAGLKISVEDQRTNTKEEFCFEKGLTEYVRYIDRDKKVFNDITIFLKDEKDKVEVDIAFEYVNDFDSKIIRSYVNDINTRDGGTHVGGFKTALTSVFNSFASKNNLIKNPKIKLVGDDFLEGLTVVISIKVPEPQFEGQTKMKLGNSEVWGIVESVVRSTLNQFLDSDSDYGKKIIERCIKVAEAREAAKRAKENVMRKSVMGFSGLPGKLSDCQLTNPDDCELYLVEGDSAGGSAKQGRDRRFQAILPLKGKIMNTGKTYYSWMEMIKNEELQSICKALGLYSPGFDWFSNRNLRYHKIIIMCDADVDGSHIRTLLLTFFYTHLRELIEDGYVYIAQPPLYKVARGTDEYYAFDDKEKQIYIDKLKEKGATDNSIHISRFKGLGEMNPQQLWETTMNPSTRTLLRVNIANCAQAEKVFRTLMGDLVEPRRVFIEQNALKAKEIETS